MGAFSQDGVRSKGSHLCGGGDWKVLDAWAHAGRVRMRDRSAMRKAAPRPSCQQNKQMTLDWFWFISCTSPTAKIPDRAKFKCLGWKYIMFYLKYITKQNYKCYKWQPSTFLLLWKSDDKTLAKDPGEQKSLKDFRVSFLFFFFNRTFSH